MKQPLVSVIVPVYNIEPYIHRCVESIMGQTYQNLEIILVDDGSPDHCPAICDQFAKRDGRVKTIHQKNAGLSAARNAGIDMSSGQYITFVDGDDYIAPNMVEVMLRRLVADGSDLCICDAHGVDVCGAVLAADTERPPIREGCFSKAKLLELLVGPTGSLYRSACYKLYKKKVFTTVMFPVGKHHEDEFVVHHIFDLCEKISCIQDRLYYYVQREGSIMHSEWSIKRLDAAEAFLDRANYYLECNYPMQAAQVLDTVPGILSVTLSKIKTKDCVRRVKTLKTALRDTYSKLPKGTSMPLKLRLQLLLCMTSVRLYGAISRLRRSSIE